MKYVHTGVMNPIFSRMELDLNILNFLIQCNFWPVTLSESQPCSVCCWIRTYISNESSNWQNSQSKIHHVLDQDEVGSNQDQMDQESDKHIQKHSDVPADQNKTTPQTGEVGGGNIPFEMSHFRPHCVPVNHLSRSHVHHTAWYIFVIKCAIHGHLLIKLKQGTRQEHMRRKNKTRVRPINPETGNRETGVWIQRSDGWCRSA